MSHFDSRFCCQYHIENVFDSAKNFTAGAPNPPHTFTNIQMSPYDEKNILGNLKKLICITP